MFESLVPSDKERKKENPENKIVTEPPEETKNIDKKITIYGEK